MKTGETSWEISGTLPLHQLSEIIGERLESDGITTTSGFVTSRLGGFPKKGHDFILGNSELRVEEMEGLRIARVRLTRLPESSGRRAIRFAN
mgnify:CR=1 FL=1